MYGRNPIAESRYTCTVLNARRNLYTISLGSPLYEDILFYHKEEGFVISKDVIYLRMELFPEGYEYRHPGYAWDERFFALFDAEHPYSQKWILYPSLDNASSKLLCASVIVGDTYEVYVVIPVDIAALLEMLMPQYSGSIIALDAEGRCMSGNGEMYQQLVFDEKSAIATDAAGRQYLYSVADSFCGVHLLVLKPYSAAEGAGAGLRMSFVVMLVFVILSTLALSLLMTFLQSRPLSGILRLLFGASQSVLSAYDWTVISGKIEQLLSDNHALHEKRLGQIRETKKYMMDALFAHTEDPDAIVARMERLGMKPRDSFFLLTFFFASTEDCARATNGITARFPEAFSCSIVDGRSLVILVRCGDICETDAQERLLSLRNACARQGVQKPCVALDAIPELGCADIFYREQLMTMEIAEEDARERVMHISNDIFGEQDIFYPTALEQQIVSGVLSGSEAQVASAFEILCQENFTLRRITDMKSRLLVERLAMTISAPLLRMTSLPDEIKLNTLRAIAKCKNQNHYRSFFAGTLEVLSPILARIRAQSEPAKKVQLGAQIIAYLKERITDPSLCLAMLADHFQMSENYLSSIVREETGEAFKAYCERLRINRACELFRQGAGIQEACERSGFSSATTFRRTFKKIVGITPSEYLEGLYEGEDEP